MKRPDSGLYHQRPRAEVVADMGARARKRLHAMPEPALVALLEDALYHERKRMERAEAKPGEHERLDALANALVRGTPDDRVSAALDIIRAWAEEVHGRFSMRAYRFATTVFPPALAALLSGRPNHLSDWNLDVRQRIEVDGDLELLRTLAAEATLVLAPTHVSNLDSPVIGLALWLAGLPPFQYGAGLNLFSNPLLGWWMHRLGAYTVDRTKKAEMYKDVLKDYSVYQLARRHHSLFFPGGTRSRSGAIEPRVKKGLLGTGLLAWQEMLEAGRKDADVYVVPMTLSFSLTLEASTLIEDFLADEGKQRYIITDDESAQPRQVAQFVQRVVSLDSALVCRFGDPIDVLGRPVPSDAADRADASMRRREYVCDREGRVEHDMQRDRVYTEGLADALVAAWPKSSTVLPTHLTAWVAWFELCRELGTTDPYRVVRTPRGRRRLRRDAYLDRLRRALEVVRDGADRGRWHVRLPEDPAAVLADAVERFGRYHRTMPLAVQGDEVVVEDPKLCLYYRNRLAHAGLEASCG